MHYSELPKLGIGLAADVSNVLPRFRDFINNDEDSIDYLSFGAHFAQLPRVKYYVADLIGIGFPVVFHPINFNVALPDDENAQYVEQVYEIAKYTNAVWTGQDVAVWTYNKQYLGSVLIPAIFDAESAKDVAAKASYLNSVLPCPFLIENPPVCFSLESMHLLDFMRLVSESADCGIVLDIGHLIAYQQATGRAIDDMPLSAFPFERVVEVHLAGLQFSYSGKNMTMIDQHSQPVHDLCWAFFEEHSSRMINLKGLTLEQEFCENSLVLKHLRKARQAVANLWTEGNEDRIRNRAAVNVG